MHQNGRKLTQGFHEKVPRTIIVNSNRENPGLFLPRCSVLMTLGNYTCCWMISAGRTAVPKRDGTITGRKLTVGIVYLPPGTCILTRIPKTMWSVSPRCSVLMTRSMHLNMFPRRLQPLGPVPWTSLPVKDISVPCGGPRLEREAGRERPPRWREQRGPGGVKGGPAAPRPRPAGGPGTLLLLLCGGPRGLRSPVNGLCGLPAGAATCSGEAPHALLFDTACGTTLWTSWPPSFSTLPLSGAMRGRALPMRASGRGVSMHACACTPQGVLCRACLLAPAHPCGTHDRFLPSRSPFEPRQSDPPSLQQATRSSRCDDTNVRVCDNCPG